VLRDDLEAAAARVREAEEALEAAKRDLRALELLAAEEGLPLALIARLTGRRSRESVYRDLERARAERG
jgi:predicted metal-dependent hydrolase